MKPTVGRIIHVYYRQPGVVDAPFLRPGIVLEVDDGLIRARVFLTTEDVNIPLPIVPREQDDYGRYWEWPPRE